MKFKIITFLFSIALYPSYIFASERAENLLQQKLSGPVETIIVTIILFSIYFILGFIVKLLFKIEIRHPTVYVILFFVGFIGKRLIIEFFG
tara:strand:- start:3478 stop:3750 length:273 start_codon:yes stop_codon:yes gene_type:complete